MNIIVASVNDIHRGIEDVCRRQLNADIVRTSIEMNSIIAEKSVDYIFFIHWSDLIPKEIYENYKCIVFHMTDLPYGRGGSPLQNLIVRGHTETKISAIKVEQGLDTGSIYLKRDLSLYGSAEEIFIRGDKIIMEMIHEIITNDIAPTPQSGEPSLFKRRKPEDSDISNLDSIEQIYDYIRMLDAEGYPKAFITKGSIKIEFFRATLKADGSIISDVKISKLK